jgi:protein-S-isoprenylcysteine O-methyltransferase Ste14
VVGVLVALAGVAVFVAAVGRLGTSLTANPKPLDDATLRRDGIYSRVRHPIYSGLLLAATGFALATSPWALLPAAALAIELDLKRQVEEDWLLVTYPDYIDYRGDVRWALIPRIR